MKNKRLQKVRLEKEQLATIKGGYKYVSGAAEAASFIGTAVDIRLALGKENVARATSFTSSLEMVIR